MYSMKAIVTTHVLYILGAVSFVDYVPLRSEVCQRPQITLPWGLLT